MRTPLTSLTAIIQLAEKKLKGNDDSFLAGAMERAEVQLKKMSTMINGFLNVSRLESGKIQIVKQTFDLGALLKESVGESEMASPRYTFYTDISDGVNVLADKDKISSVISNLLSNAIKYSPKGKSIYINCLSEGGQTKVSVRDEGMGIMPDDKARLFERYYRVEANSSLNISGFGIGLYLSAEIIERHKGKIRVESEFGEGSTFWFTLPLENQG